MTGAGDPLSNNHAAEYRKKFGKLLQESKAGEKWVYWVMGGLGIIFLLLISLVSKDPGSIPFGVSAYVASILAAGLWCLFEVKEMRSKGFKQALTHLVLISTDLEGGDSDLSLLLSKLRDSDDESHVPESVSQLISSPRSVPAIQAVAEACFIYPGSRLELLGYFRTLLVLAGLFGTVLFFGFSIQDKSLDIANAEAILAGLAGALGCTLMGTASSGLVGVMAAIF